MGVEKHPVVLQQIRSDQKGPAVRQLDMGDLQLGPLAAEEGMVLAQIKLKHLPGAKSQGNEGAAPGRLLLSLPICPPATRKSCNPAAGPREPEHHQIGMELLQRPALLA